MTDGHHQRLMIPIKRAALSPIPTATMMTAVSPKMPMTSSDAKRMQWAVKPSPYGIEPIRFAIGGKAEQTGVRNALSESERDQQENQQPGDRDQSDSQFVVGTFGRLVAEWHGILSRIANLHRLAKRRETQNCFQAFASSSYGAGVLP